MELRKAQLIRVLNDEGVDVRDIDTRLDNGGAYQNLGLSAHDGVHHRGQHVLFHLPVGHGDRHVLQKLPQADGSAINVVDAIMQIIDLPAALDLAPDGVGYNAPVVLQHEGLHRQAILRRLLDIRHVADAGHGHVECAGDGRCRESQHVHALRELLDMLLVGDAEALLLIHHEKAEVFEFHILAEKAVGADHKVKLPALQIPEGSGIAGPGAETA